MPKTHPIFDRYWSQAAALLLPVIEFTSEGIIRLFMDYEVARAMLSAACIALLVHSWFQQRRYAENKWRHYFWTLFISLVALGPIWLGLNVVRFYSYDVDVDYQRNSTLWYHNLYWYVVELQDTIILLAEILGILVFLWMIIDLARWLTKRIGASVKQS
jgi:hypothetical protein